MPAKLPKSVLIALTIAFLSFTSCTNRKPNLPGGVLTEEKMANVLTDIRLAEGSFRVLSQNGIVSLNYIDSSYQQIYKLHKIESWQMDSSLSFYSNHPKILHNIFDKSADQLTDISLSKP
jgi:hypothetical protein